jgi:hypothetical protein
MLFNRVKAAGERPIGQVDRLIQAATSFRAFS